MQSVIFAVFIVVGWSWVGEVTAFCDQLRGTDETLGSNGYSSEPMASRMKHVS